MQPPSDDDDEEGSCAASLASHAAALHAQPMPEMRPDFSAPAAKRPRRQCSRVDSEPARIRGHTGGSLEYHIAAEASGMNRGPPDIESLANWPDHLLSQLWTSESHKEAGGVAKHRIAALLQSGVLLHSDCSGKLSPETSLAMLTQALRKCIPLPEVVFSNWRACDSSPLCQRLIMQSGHDPVHVFDGLLGMLPLRHQDHIVSLRPAASATDEVKAQSMDAMGMYLRKHPEIFRRSSVATNCLRHPGQACATAWSDPVGVEWWQRPLTAAMAGTPCRPWSQMGVRSQGAHPDQEAWHLWVADMAGKEFDLVGLENSELFPVPLFANSMPKKYVIKSAVWGAQDSMTSLLNQNPDYLFDVDYQCFST